MNNLVAHAFEGSVGTDTCGIAPLVVKDQRSETFHLLHDRISRTYDTGEFDELCNRGFATRLARPVHATSGVVAFFCGADAYELLKGAGVAPRITSAWQRLHDETLVSCMGLEEAVELSFRLGDAALEAGRRRIVRHEWSEARAAALLALSAFPRQPLDEQVGVEGRFVALLQLGICFRRHEHWLAQGHKLAGRLVKHELGLDPEKWERCVSGYERHIFTTYVPAMRWPWKGAAGVLGVVRDVLAAIDDGAERTQAYRELTTFLQCVGRSPSSSTKVSLAAYSRPTLPSEADFKSRRDAREVENELFRAVEAVVPQSSNRRTYVLPRIALERTVNLYSGKHWSPDLPKGLAEQHKNYFIRRLRQIIPEYNFVPLHEKQLDALSARLGVKVKQVRNLALPASSLFKPDANERLICLREQMWEGERVFLWCHELGHWLLHYPDSPPGHFRGVFDRAISTCPGQAEDEVNTVAMVGVWPSPALAWIALQAVQRTGRQARSEVVQPPYTHLSATNDEHINLLLEFLVQQYGPLREQIPPEKAERLEEYLRHYARLRISAYNRFMSSWVLFRSPGIRNWFCQHTSGSDEVMAARTSRLLQETLRSDESVIWGTLDKKGRLQACSKSFERLVGIELAKGMDVSILFDDEVPFFRWEGREWTSLDVYRAELGGMAGSNQPFVYYVLYRASWKHNGLPARVLCRLQTTSIVNTSGDWEGSTAIIEPSKVMTLDGGRLQMVSPTVLEERGLAIPRAEKREGRMDELEARLCASGVLDSTSDL